MSEKLAGIEEVILEVLKSKGLIKAKRGRPRKTPEEKRPVGRPPKKKVGRPRINPEPLKRPVGRPKKFSPESLGKKRRGRPRKYDVEMLNKSELEMVQPLISYLKSLSKPAHTDKVINHLNAVLKANIADTALRKVVNYIRAKSLAPIVSLNSNGYFITQRKSAIQEQIDSLNKRAACIVASANGLKSFL